jgi:PAS domain S-box-containing protein
VARADDLPRKPATPSPWPAGLGFAALALLIVAGGVLSYRTGATYLEAEHGRELETVAVFKAAQVAQWQGERLTDARLLAGDSLLSRGLREGPAVAAKAREELEEWLPVLKGSGAYVGVAVVDADGVARYAAGEPPPSAAVLRPLLAAAGGAAVATDIERQDDALRIAFLAPLPAVAGRSPGAVVLSADPAPHLFPMVVSWHRPSRTGRGVLVGVRDGAPLVYTPVDGPAGPTRVDIPAGPSAMALRGETGPARSRDRRGRETLAATAPVPGTAWSVIAREDLDDVLAPLAARRGWTLAATLGLLLLAAVGTFAGWRAQVSRAEQVRLRAELERAAMARRLEHLTRFANDMIFLADEQQRIVEANERAEQLLGYAREELIGMPVVRLRHPSSAADYTERVREQVERGSVRFETTYQRRDGSPLPVEVSIFSDVVDGRRFFHGIARDVTDRKRLEAELLLAARMATVGTLAAGVAHEINNPLAFILSNVDFALKVLRRAGGDAELVQALEDARDGSIRVREIVRGLQALSRADDAQETIDLRAVVQAAADLAGPDIRRRAALVIDGGAVPPVQASTTGLGQAIVGLLVNAAQAIPEGHPAEHTVRVATATSPDGRAVVEVSDTGAGIPPDVLPRVFDPFFTTRPVGTGTGLGLSICHGIVSRAGGEITVASAVGKGTTFRILLPPAGAPPPGPAQAPAVPAVPAPARARILVIDDEPLVGSAVARLLSTEHDVTTRTSSREALDELLGGARYDLVLCDLMMPEVTGMALHARLAALDPALAARVIFLTGGTFTEEAEEFLQRIGAAPVEKPFEGAVLRERVAAALASAARS